MNLFIITYSQLAFDKNTFIQFYTNLKLNSTSTYDGHCNEVTTTPSVKNRTRTRILWKRLGDHYSLICRRDAESTIFRSTKIGMKLINSSDKSRRGFRIAVLIKKANGKFSDLQVKMFKSILGLKTKTRSCSLPASNWQVEMFRLKTEKQSHPLKRR